MSIYDNDPRVSYDVRNCIYTVSCHARCTHPTARIGQSWPDWRVLHLDGSDVDGGPLFETADEAIHSLIGDPPARWGSGS